MKITIKTVKVVIGEFEVEPEQTILQLKQQIADHENVTPECISLIYKSKMLKDDAQTLEQIKVQDGDTIVIVLKKAAQTAKPAAKPVEQPKPVETKEEPKQEQPAQPAPQPSAPAQDGVNIFQEQPKPAAQPAPEPSEDNIVMLMGMGFGREESTKALKKTRDNVQLAANLLLEGANLDAIPDPQEAPAHHGDDGNMGGAVPGFGSKEDFVAAYQASPQEYEPILQSIAMQNPQLATLARNNPGVLYDLIMQVLQQQGGMGAAPQPQPHYQPAPQVAPQQPAAPAGPQLSAQDEEAIGRLQQLGFSRQQCIQAYLVCDKNETYAANMLLDGLI